MTRIKYLKEVCGENGAAQFPGDVVDVGDDRLAAYLVGLGNAVPTTDELGQAYLDGEE